MNRESNAINNELNWIAHNLKKQAFGNLLNSDCKIII